MRERAPDQAAAIPGRTRQAGLQASNGSSSSTYHLLGVPSTLNSKGLLCSHFAEQLGYDQMIRSNFHQSMVIWPSGVILCLLLMLRAKQVERVLCWGRGPVPVLFHTSAKKV